MKRTLVNLRVGQVLEARVSEVISSTDLIVNFQGDLIRVRNQTQLRMQQGSLVPLIVVSVDPLGFKVRSAGNSFSVVV